MVDVRHVSPRPGDVLLLVGTMKGAFVFRSDASRRKWQRAGPYFPGHAVYAMAYDGRGDTPRLWAGPESAHWGAVLQSSDDFGRTWAGADEGRLRFPDDAGAALKRIWQIAPAPGPERDVLYCGVEPAALFVSRDGGRTLALVRGLYDHPQRPRWQPGGGGLGLHTIVSDAGNPRRMWVAISTAGVYRTDDGGATWQPRNSGVRAVFLPDQHPEFGQCVHKIVQHPARPDRLFLQNHWGLYRSDDAGDSWHDVANGVPSDFGFAMAAHPHDADTVYIVPLESDEFRCTPQGKLRVYRTRNAGRSWQALGRGLPQSDAFETVLRDALATDTLPRAGVYFGTRSGRVYASADEGASWRSVAESLPPVVCVKAAVVGGRRAPVRRRVARRPPSRRPASRRG